MWTATRIEMCGVDSEVIDDNKLTIHSKSNQTISNQLIHCAKNEVYH